MSLANEESVPWRRRAKGLVSQQLRQFPCLHAILPALSCCKCRSKSYQTLGQDEDDDSAAMQDVRQNINKTFGTAMIRTAMFVAVAITIKLVVTNRRLNRDYNYGYIDEADGSSTTTSGPEANPYKEPSDADLKAMEEMAKESFHRDSPIVLYMAVIELLACGACATTAASMYRRRRHQLQHPSESSDKIKAVYIKVHLEKEAGQEDKQSFGLGFRPSSDGLECLLVETVRWGSPLDSWNRSRHRPSPEEMMEEALGDDDTDRVEATAESNASGTAGGNDAAATGDAGSAGAGEAQVPDRPVRRSVEPGSAIVAVNDVHGDVGMMQLQLLKPKVTLWVRQEFNHASQFQDGLFARDMELAGGHHQAGSLSQGGARAAPSSGIAAANGSGLRAAGLEQGSTAPPSLQAMQIGASEATMMDWVAHAGFIMGLPSLTKGPRCACVGLEDEEPQILNRWLACSLIFGWVTMLPVLLMQPHEERPRQHLFRQFLLKPCIIVLPIWMTFWLIDCVQVAVELPIVTPVYYFGIVHMVLPAVLVWYLFQMQAADEELVLEQRSARAKEILVGTAMPLAVEDPAPTFLRELIMMNPVALVWLGACAAIPLVCCSFLTPMKTERGKMAQGVVNVIYSPLIPLQMAFGFVLWHLKFQEVPKLYLTGFGLLLSLPCFVIWCLCVVCSSRYGRKDLALVRQQRLERGKAAKQSAENPELAPDAAEAQSARERPVLPNELVDCSEAQCREWELIYTA